MSTEDPGRLFNIYAVKDELTNKFMQPIFINSDKEAKRWFKYVLNDNKIWQSNAEEFSFYKIGSFNEKTGLIMPEVNPVLVTGGKAVKEE